jgi:ubiquinone/menaquinone biosynthesis C-methylase UbiE
MSRSDFDPTAAQFDRLRALPPGVPERIRGALWQALGNPSEPRVLDVGAGTGRIGGVFVAAGDAYVALDFSASMLSQFARRYRSGGAPLPALVQADGRWLPFPSAVFDAVLMVQVVSGSADWSALLSEAIRVLTKGGALVLGRTVGPPEGVDARMRAQMYRILAQWGIDARRPGAGQDDTRAWLRGKAGRMLEVIAAEWEAERSPRAFLERHASGARFAALPPSIKEDALKRLADWAGLTFGALESPHLELHAFVLDVCIL